MLYTQRYTSSELFHFVGQKDLDDDARYQRFVKIIRSGILSPNGSEGLTSSGSISFNNQFSGNKMFNPSMVCFCDIPVEGLGIHMQKYSYFGLSFTREYLVKMGANPVFYNVLKSKILNKERESYFNDEVALYFERWRKNVFLTAGRCTTNKDELKRKKEFSNEFDFFLTSFFNYTVFFDHDKEGSDPDNYYMEREWRILGKLDFKIADIYRVVIPRDYLRKFNTDIADYGGHVLTVDNNN